jgi:UDPglucose 6-dehydrogenase
MDNARKSWPTLSYADSVLDACRGAHLVLVLTEWAQYCELEPATLTGLVATPAIVDGRNCLDPDVWSSAGWTYRALGRPLVGRADRSAHDRAAPRHW